MAVAEIMTSWSVRFQSLEVSSLNAEALLTRAPVESRVSGSCASAVLIRGYLKRPLCSLDCPVRDHSLFGEDAQLRQSARSPMPGIGRRRILCEPAAASLHMLLQIAKCARIAGRLCTCERYLRSAVSVNVPCFARGHNVLDIPSRRLRFWQVKCLEEHQRPAVCFQLQPDRRAASKRSNGTSLIGWAIEVRCWAFSRSHSDRLLPNASSTHL
jgi:hypothetical protein